MAKKKKSKRKNKKIKAKDKAREKAKALEVKQKEKAKKEKIKVKKAKVKEKNTDAAASPETSKGKRGAPGIAISEAKTSGTSSLSVNARTAVSKIKTLGKTDAINNYIAGDKRVTVKKAATSRIASISGK